MTDVINLKYFTKKLAGYTDDGIVDILKKLENYHDTLSHNTARTNENILQENGLLEIVTQAARLYREQVREEEEFATKPIEAVEALLSSIDKERLLCINNGRNGIRSSARGHH